MYNIKPFKDEVLHDVASFEVCDVLLGQSYLWKWHDVYESIPHYCIVYLGNMLYKILEVVLLSAISLISAKQNSKLISQTRKFVLFLIHSQGKGKVIAISMACMKGSST